MIKPEKIEEILTTYEKHGWTLRRVLLSDGLRVSINDALQDLFGGAEIVSSPMLNALWFSRASGKSGEAWELRHLSSSPFALVEVFASEEDEKAKEERRKAMEARLFEKTSKS